MRADMRAVRCGAGPGERCRLARGHRHGDTSARRSSPRRCRMVAAYGDAIWSPMVEGQQPGRGGEDQPRCPDPAFPSGVRAIAASGLRAAGRTGAASSLVAPSTNERRLS